MRLAIAVLKPFESLMLNFDRKIKNAGFILACLFLFALYFLIGAGFTTSRYLYTYAVGCLFLGIMILCSIRGEISYTIKINKPFFIVWMIYGGLQLLSGIINNVDFLPETMLILVGYPLLFLAWSTWELEQVFGLLVKTCIFSSVVFILICFLFFPLCEQYTGPFLNQNFTGQYLSLVICCLIMEIYKPNKKIFVSFNFVILLGFNCAFLYYTGSRTGMLSSLVAVVVFIILTFAKSKSPKSVLKVSIVLVLSVILISRALVPLFDLRSKLLPHFFDEIETSENYDETNHIIKDKLSIEGKNADELSSGRVYIWKHYIEELSIKGHKINSVYIPENADKPWRALYASNAHNVIIQQAYNHGILAGIATIIFNLYGGILALYYGIKKRSPYALMPIVIIVAYGITSVLATLTSSFSYLILLYYYLVQAPLLIEKENDKVFLEEKRDVT